MVGQYKGDVSPEEAWRALSEKKDAVLVDVRTFAEWKCVGITDLSKLSKDNILIEWVDFPNRNPNENFIEELKAAVPLKNTPVYFLCRTAVRSIGAATAATEAGYEDSYNILEGFEGVRDDQGHRGKISGWQGLNLPWKH